MASLKITNTTCLYGENFEVKEGDLLIEEGKIQGLYPSGKGPEAEESIDGSSHIALPGLVNSHVHLLDSPLKEEWVGKAIPHLFGPQGVKNSYIQETPEEILLEAAKEAWRELLLRGVTSALVYVEDGTRGLEILRRSRPERAPRTLLLGRPGSSGEDFQEIEALLEQADGIGMGGLGDFKDEELKQIRSLCEKKGKVLSTHMAEVGPTENFDRALNLLGAHFLVHGNYLRKEELSLIEERALPLVCCIRSGKSFGRETPDLADLTRRGIPFGLATDNLMSNSPDLFREMEFVTRDLLFRHQGEFPLKPEKILASVTHQGARLAGWKDVGLIEPGFWADVLLLKKRGSLTPFLGALTVIFRGDPGDIEWIVLSGKPYQRSEL